MKGIMNWFTNKLAPGMQKVFSNPWIAAVASAMQKILPFILVGSVISIYNVFVRYIPSLPDLSFVNTFSFGMMSLIVAGPRGGHNDGDWANSGAGDRIHPAILIKKGIAFAN